MLKAALARGANLVDAFANSPPWWMTVSGGVAGGVDGTNNLQVADEVPFADYLATVVSNLTVRDGVHFNFVTPINEPSDAWNCADEKQEGCHVSPAQQARVIDDLRAALNASAPSSGVDGPEDYDEYQSLNDLENYSATTLSHIALLSTHTYKANDPDRLSNEAAVEQKPLWVTEYGDGDRTGLTMAKRIHDDITDMRVRAWVYWQVVDSAYGWGFLYNTLAATNDENFTTNYIINRKFYAMGQFSKFIRPGCEIISVNDTNTLAAYNPTNSTLVLVAVNTNHTRFNVTYDVSAFGSMPWHVNIFQTARRKNLDALPQIRVAHQRFTSVIPARSITTFVLTTNTISPPRLHSVAVRH